jgi:hypothetical protein
LRRFLLVEQLLGAFGALIDIRANGGNWLRVLLDGGSDPRELAKGSAEAKEAQRVAE